MQRNRTQECDRIDEAQCLPGPRSERVGPASHATPIVPAAEPTDPLASAGPMLSPSDWPSTDELESAEITGLFSEIEPILPRDTLPSPPPSPEEPLRFELPRRR